jgi:hypothetical protein
MVLTDDNCTCEIEIIGYEFPECKPFPATFDHDANWLNMELKYIKDNYSISVVSPCILTSEIERTLSAFDLWLRQEINKVSLICLEPNFRLELRHMDLYVRFWPEISGKPEKESYVLRRQTTAEEVRYIRDCFAEWVYRYPVRFLSN